MELKQAQTIAMRVMEGFKPHCQRIVIAGSIRRKKPQVKDIELVCIPKYTMCDALMPDLFGNTSVVPQQTVTDGFAKEFKQYYVEKGKPTGKYVKFQTMECINVDMFIASPQNWGYILAIRTGSADYSHRVLATGWVKAGYKGGDGMLYKNGVAIPVLEEEDLFKLIGIDWIAPEKRVRDNEAILKEWFS